MKKNSLRKIVFLLVPLLCFILFSLLFIRLDFTARSSKLPEGYLSQSTKNMIATIKTLSSKSREYGTSREKKAYNYLESRLKSYGYKPYIQRIRRRDKAGLRVIQSQNLIAVKKNTAKDKKGIIIICAHYDSDKNSYGANDDASGCAVVLETARLLKEFSSTYEVRFIFFGMEKYFNAGSTDYAGRLSEKDVQNIRAVIEIDSIAKNNNIKPELFTVSGKGNTATEILKSANNKKLSINKIKTYQENSDYGIFDYFMMPALCISQPYSDRIDFNKKDKDAISGIDQSKLKYVMNIIINTLK